MKTDKQRELYAKVLDTIYTQRPISRVDISTFNGITPATVGNITKELLAEQLICEVGELDDHTVGRKKILLDIKKNACYFLGVELTEKHFYAVITDNLGTILDTKDLEITDTDKAYTSSFVIQFITEFLEKHAELSIKAIGMALPGHYDRQKGDAKHINTNNPVWRHVDLQELSHSFDIPVYYSNNGHCLIIAKRLFDKNTSQRNFIIFHVGRGMHCSYMYEGRIFSRYNPAIGEIGHTVVNPNGELCECGKRGCLQTYASNTWILKKARLLYRATDKSYLKSLVQNEEDLTLDHLLAAYELGDLGAMTLIDTAINYLVVSISNLTLLLDVEQIYLHGKFISYPKLADKILNTLNQTTKVLENQHFPDISVMPFSVFNGAVGAVGLCIDEYYLSYKGKI
ncbi:ROK family transcriptional regulator [Streptococcus hyointestinalis]|uniref:ROK family transcriptional regulator n=1 Tax=Streptococcus hyointestinalis TaxID=1337 RepID=UPI0013DEA535|nr:ROK family transcriptional regulator [Streptococcus hyointestinalis]